MRMIDVRIHEIIDSVVGSSRIELVARFEDVINGFSHTTELTDVIKVNSTEFAKVFEETQRLEREHPFFKLRLCESPIELRFFVYAMHKIPGLHPQVVVDSYRIDLAVPEKKVAIELDGHEFHKSREQRTYDAKRQRYLQRQGWQVIRFTGTEIYEDVFKCIDEAIEIINRMPFSD